MPTTTRPTYGRNLSPHRLLIVRGNQDQVHRAFTSVPRNFDEVELPSGLSVARTSVRLPSELNQRLLSNSGARLLIDLQPDAPLISDVESDLKLSPQHIRHVVMVPDLDGTGFDYERDAAHWQSRGIPAAVLRNDRGSNRVRLEMNALSEHPKTAGEDWMSFIQWANDDPNTVVSSSKSTRLSSNGRPLDITTDESNTMMTLSQWDENNVPGTIVRQLKRELVPDEDIIPLVQGETARRTRDLGRDVYEVGPGMRPSQRRWSNTMFPELHEQWMGDANQLVNNVYVNFVE